VDDNCDAIGAIERNLKKARLTGRVVPDEVFRFLVRSLGRVSFDGAARPGRDSFDIIFADPPYEQSKSGEHFTEKLLSDEALARLLRPGGIFVLEKRPGEKLPELPLWNLLRQKKYGATEVLFLAPIQNPQSELT
jgi:16S rRNA G966 N2-methylase RsmD